MQMTVSTSGNVTELTAALVAMITLVERRREKIRDKESREESEVG